MREYLFEDNELTDEEMEEMFIYFKNRQRLKKQIKHDYNEDELRWLNYVGR